MVYKRPSRLGPANYVVEVIQTTKRVYITSQKNNIYRLNAKHDYSLLPYCRGHLIGEEGWLKFMR